MNFKEHWIFLTIAFGELSLRYKSKQMTVENQLPKDHQMSQRKDRQPADVARSQ